MTGESLKELLLSLKISQTDIAKKLGLSQQSFNQMLSASDVKSSLLERVADAIGMSISKMYEGCCGKDPFSPNPENGLTTDLQRTHNGGTTEAERDKDEYIKELEAKVAERDRVIAEQAVKLSRYENKQ